MDYWLLANWSYILISLLGLIPTLKKLFLKIELKPGGATFIDSNQFSEPIKKKLKDHYSRLQGTLLFWKKQAAIYTKFHYYCAFSTIVSSSILPFIATIAPQTPGSNSKWLVVIISSHVALSIGFHKGLKISEGMKGFRQGESEFYDLYRRLLDRPHLFGTNEIEQMNTYFAEVERIRQQVRNTETESTPDIQSITKDE
jgi:hypothetical protein